MKKINFQAIATTIQKDLRKKGAFHDKEEIVSRLNDLTFYDGRANAFDYMDYYSEHFYPPNLHEQVVECGSPTVTVEFDVDAANDED
jgi:hypothetical protein